MITEIMYNSPDPGQDSLEFIEIYNAGDAVDLSGYSMIGVTYEFPSVMIMEEEFYYITSDSEAFLTTFGVIAAEFTGATSNSGEELSILDANGISVFTVDYDDNAPWPTEDDGTDGLGASIVLCDFENPNNGLSWKSSATSSGQFFNGIEIFSNINSITDVACDSGPSGTIVTTDGLTFLPADITINQGETITFTNGGGSHNVNGGQDIFPDNPQSFYSGEPSSEDWLFPFTFNLAGLYNYQCDLHAGLGMVGTVTVLPASDNSDIRITEVFYNSASTPDSLEYIEIYNAGTDPAEIEGLNLVSSVINSNLSSNATLSVGEYGIIAKDSAAFSVAFPGVEVLAEWGAGTLSNSGDFITILRNAETIATAEYSDDGEWPTEADGAGASLIVCDPLGGFSVDNISAGEYPEINFEGKTFFVTPGSENYCSFDIADVSQVDSEGFNTMNGINAIVTGTVYGINLRPGGLQFTIIDDEGDGISTFSAESDFGYIVNETDKVTLIGTIGQFNGLSQIYLDTMFFEETSSISSPEIVVNLSENTESQLVKIENVTIVDSDQWLNTGVSFNFEVTDGTNVYNIRIDEEVEGIAGMGYPTGEFSITGIGGQFDELAPYTEGYQLLPRYLSDIDPFNEFIDFYPPRSIVEVSGEDANGLADSLDIQCTLEGRVLGINLRPNGLEFTLVDPENNGIAVFSNTEQFEYSVNEGDLLRIKGRIEQFNGLTEIIPDSLFFVETGVITEIDEVTVIDESTESSFIFINELLILPDPTEWKGDGTSFSVTAEDSNSGVLYEIYIDNDSDVSIANYNDAPFTLKGIGSQRDVSSPFDSGYRIVPRSISDFNFIVSTKEEDISHAVDIYPNPVSNELYFIYDGLVKGAIIYTMLGEEIPADIEENTINISKLTNGQYTLKLITDKGVAIKAFLVIK